jgi:hypothetical protein
MRLSSLDAHRTRHPTSLVHNPIIIVYVESARLVRILIERWAQPDNLGMVRRLGALPG